MSEADLHLLKSPDEDIRCAAVLRLGEREVNSILESLVSALSDPSWRVRKLVVRVLEKADRTRLVPLLIEALREENAGVRNSAIECLTGIGPEAIAPLGQALLDPDKDLRIFAVNTLGAIGDRAAYPHLARALTDPEKNVCHAAIDALGKVKDPRAVEPLIRIVQGEDIWLKLPAIATLGELGDPRAIPYLLPLSQDFLFKQTVIEALGTLGDASGIPCILQGLEDQDLEVQKAALLALKKVVSKTDRIHRMIGHGPNLRAYLNQICTPEALNYILRASEEESPEIAEAAIFLLGWIDAPQAIEALIRLLSYERLSDLVMDSLLRSGAQALPALIESYEFSEYDQKLRVLEGLSRLSGDLLSDPEEGSAAETGPLTASLQENLLKALKVFISSLAHEEEELGVLSLRTLSSEKFIKFLKQETLQTHPLFEEILTSVEQALRSHSSLLRAEAVKWMGQLKGATVLEMLHPASKDLDGRVRAAAIAQIGRLAQQDSDLLDPVIIALSDDDPRVREQAALALGAIPQPKAFEALIQATQDEDLRVKRTVINTLGRFQDPRVLETLEYILSHCKRREEGTIRAAICQTLGGFEDSEKSMDLLTELLADYDFVVRRTAALSLGSMKTRRERAKDLLFRALEDAHWSVKEAAVKSLGRLGIQEGEALFLKLLSHSEIGLRKEAVRALAEINSGKAVGLLMDLLLEESLSQEAYQALVKLAGSYKPLIEENRHLYPNPLVQRLVQSLLDKS